MKQIAFALALTACAFGITAASGAKAALPFSETGLLNNLAHGPSGPDFYAFPAGFSIFGFGGYTNLTDPSRTVGSYTYPAEKIAFSLNIDGTITNVDRFYVVDEYWSDHLTYDSSGHLIGSGGGSDYTISDPGNFPPYTLSGGSIYATITARETSTVAPAGAYGPLPGDYDLYQQSYRPLYVFLELEVDAAPGATYSVSAMSIPEPATWAMMVMGLAGVGAALRSRRTKVGMA